MIERLASDVVIEKGMVWPAESEAKGEGKKERRRPRKGKGAVKNKDKPTLTPFIPAHQSIVNVIVQLTE